MKNDPLIQPAALPGPIVTALNRLIQRSRRLMLFRGLCASCAAGVGAFILIMLIDATVILMVPWPRWIMTTLAYSLWGAATFWFLIRPLMRSFTLAGIARLIETHHPELQERISSAVQLLSSKDSPSIRGSETLIAALTEEAVREAITLKPRQEISFRAVTPFLIAAGFVLLTFATLYWLRPQQTRFLLARATAPFLNLPNVHALDLRIEPGDTLIAAGSSLQVVLHSSNPLVKSPRLRLVDDHGRESILDMKPMAATTNQPGHGFSTTLPSLQNPLTYRVHAGDALSRYFTVRVATPPVIEHLDIHYRYPEYSRLGTKLEHDGSGTIRALAGTAVTISAQVNKPATQAILVINASQITNSITGSQRIDGKTIVYDFNLTLPAGLNGGWTLRLSDEINLVNTPFEHPIQAIPDNPPSITIGNPGQRELRLNRSTRLPVSYHAEDDYGLASIALVFTFPGSTNEQLQALPFQEAAFPRLINGETSIVLTDSMFAAVPRASFRIRVFDNLPASSKGPQFSDSELFNITFDDQADSWPEQVLASQEKRVQEGLKAVQDKLADAGRQAKALNNPKSLQQPLTDDTTRKIDTLQDTLAAADNALREIASDVDKGFFDTLSSNLTALADNHVSKAENMTGQIPLVDTPTERMDIVSNITAEITAARDNLAKTLEEHERAKSMANRAVELDQLANTQAALAQSRESSEASQRKSAADTSAQGQADAATLKEWSSSQDRVANDLARLALNTPGTTALLADSLRNQSANAAAKAADLAKRQEALSALSRKEIKRIQEQEAQWRALAARQNKLADLAQAEPLASAQTTSMRQAAKDLESGRSKAAIETQSQVADALEEAARKAGETTRQGRKNPKTGTVSALASQQEQLHKEAAALQAATQAEEHALREKPSLQNDQETIAKETAELSQQVDGFKAHSEELFPYSKGILQAAQTVQHLAHAAQSASEAAKHLVEATLPGKDAAQRQQAALQTGQTQHSAAQSLLQAAAKLRQMANTDAFLPPKAPAGVQAPASPETQDALAKAFQSASEASQSAMAVQARAAADQLAQAAQLASNEAKAMGVNVHPQSMRSSNRSLSGRQTTSQPAEALPSFARRLGLRLQDWLRLHGELKDDVLQAANTEGPEEYRPIIQRYFREVSGHGEEE